MKTVAVTGGTGDLGNVVVPRLLRDYRCAVVYRSEKSWENLKSSLRAGESLVGLANATDIKTVAPIYALILLAGGYAGGASPDDFSKMLEMNLLANVRAIDAALPHLENGGRIVAISSAASLTKRPGIAAYAASKAALNAVIETLAKELKDRGITVNALLPATIDTIVKREHVADAISLLLAPQASKISGQLIGMSV